MRTYQTGLLALALAATPAAAVTKLVNFSFTVGGTAAHGVYTLDCASNIGACTVTALSGFFGLTPLALTPLPPVPPATPPVVPDNQVTQPGFVPSANGVGFSSVTELPGGSFHIDSFFDVFTDLSIDGGLTWMPSDGGAHVDLNDYETDVPEPASWALMVAGFGAMGLALRARRPRGMRAVRAGGGGFKEGPPAGRAEPCTRLFGWALFARPRKPAAAYATVPPTPLGEAAESPSPQGGGSSLVGGYGRCPGITQRIDPAAGAAYVMTLL